MDKIKRLLQFRISPPTSNLIDNPGIDWWIIKSGNNREDRRDKRQKAIE